MKISDLFELFCSNVCTYLYKWVELGWIGLNWVELGWIGLNWVELGNTNNHYHSSLSWVELSWIESWSIWFCKPLFLKKNDSWSLLSFSVHDINQVNMDKLQKFGAGSAKPIVYGMSYDILLDVFTQLKQTHLKKELQNKTCSGSF